jgi:uncharacterized protein
MKARLFDALRLDVVAFAAAQGELDCAWPLAGMHRLQESVSGVLAAHPDVVCQAHGFEVPLQVGPPEVWIVLSAQACLLMQCQRCLGDVEVALSVNKRFRFVATEVEAAALDDELEDDVLEQQPELNLQLLAEDELLLELPIVPRHEACSQPLHRASESPASPEPPNPFAALTSLKARPDT